MISFESKKEVKKRKAGADPGRDHGVHNDTADCVCG